MVICGDCLQIMAGMPEDSIDTIITDPPYGLGTDQWDTEIPIAKFMKESYKVLKNDGFLAFFGQMPTVINWINEANNLFDYKEHISWVKRNIIPSRRLCRTHEEIFIYSKGNSTFYKTKGKFTDVKCDGLYFDIATIENIKRYISAMHKTIKGGDSVRYNVGSNSHPAYKRYAKGDDYSRCPEYVNYTNVWSFLPANQSNRNGEYHHPCKKPLPIIERLVEMLSDKGMLVLDPFAGSCTTAVACKKTGRKGIMIEKLEKYCKGGKERLNVLHKELF